MLGKNSVIFLWCLSGCGASSTGLHREACKPWHDSDGCPHHPARSSCPSGSGKGSFPWCAWHFPHGRWGFCLSSHGGCWHDGWGCCLASHAACVEPLPYPWTSLSHDGWGCCLASHCCCAKPLPCPWNGFCPWPDGWGCCLSSHGACHWSDSVTFCCACHAGWGSCHSSHDLKPFSHTWSGFVTSCWACPYCSSSSSKIWKLWGACELQVRQAWHWHWHPFSSPLPSWPASGPARFRQSLPLFPLPWLCGGQWHNPMGAALPLPLDLPRCEWTDSRSGNGSWMGCGLLRAWSQGAWLPPPVPWPSGWNGRKSNPHCWNACGSPCSSCGLVGSPELASNQTPSLRRDWVTSVGLPTRHSTPWCWLLVS